MDHIKSEISKADPFSSWWPFLASGIVFILTIVRTFMGGQMNPATNRINNLVCIVTGCSGGIGLEIVKDLTFRGAHVIMACRNIEKSEKQKKLVLKYNQEARIDIHYMDLRSFDCIRRFVKTVEEKYEHVDILINNAGITAHPREKTVDGFESHLQVNYLGHFLLSHLLIPMLKNAEQGRIINIAAHAYVSGKMSIEDPLNIGKWSTEFHARESFAHSKLAIVLSTRYFARILNRDSKITVNSCTPGLVRGTDHLRQSPIMKALCAKVITYPWMWIFMKSPLQGAQTPIYLAIEQKLSSTNGEYFNDCEISEVLSLAKEDDLAKALYYKTIDVLKLK